MIKVTARARFPLSPILHFQSFKMGKAGRGVCVVVSWTRHTAPTTPPSQAVMDLRLSQRESGGDNKHKPQPALLDDKTEYTTRRAGPQCVFKKKHTR